MKAEYGVALHNKFEIQVVAADGTVKQEITAYNVVLNRYYTDLSNNTTMYFGRLYLGTGTGTPSVTDTGLFTQLTTKNFEFSTTDVTFIDVNSYSVATTLTFTETEAVGLITELGIGNRSSVLYTHAMITDAEGNIIAINKTNTDRLIITLTLYLTLNVPSNVVSYHGLSTDCYSVYASQQATAGTSYLPRIISAALGLNKNICDGRNEYVYYSGSPGCPTMSLGADYVGYKTLSTKLQASVTQGILRMANSERILSTDSNLSGTYQIYGMNTPIGYIPITSDVFPVLPLTLSKTADGTQKAFNFGVGELLPDVKVYINDVLQPANSYTWNGKDYSIFQVWETARADKVIKTPVCKAHSNYYQCYTTPIYNYQPMFGNTATWVNKDIVYDFGERLNFTRAYKPNASTAYTNWEYSNDNQTWTTINIPASPSTNYYDFPTPISARYLRMREGVTTQMWVNNWTPMLPELCCYSDQLVFNTAPSAGSIIKIEAKSAYPIKNEHWIIDQFVLDVKISRA